MPTELIEQYVDSASVITDLVALGQRVRALERAGYKLRGQEAVAGVGGDLARSFTGPNQMLATGDDGQVGTLTVPEYGALIRQPAWLAATPYFIGPGIITPTYSSDSVLCRTRPFGSDDPREAMLFAQMALAGVLGRTRPPGESIFNDSDAGQIGGLSFGQLFSELFAMGDALQFDGTTTQLSAEGPFMFRIEDSLGSSAHTVLPPGPTGSAQRGRVWLFFNRLRNFTTSRRLNIGGNGISTINALTPNQSFDVTGGNKIGVVLVCVGDGGNYVAFDFNDRNT